MLLLALDTTTRAGSIALVRDGRVLDSFTGDPARTHGERLPGDIVVFLERHSVEPGDIDVFGVAAGPGSFTGLRIGIAAIQGLAFALGRPVVAVSVLDALAVVAASESQAVEQRLVGAWMDAQRNEVFAALYRPPSGDAMPWRTGDQPRFAVVDGPVSEPPRSILERWRDIAAGQQISVAGDAVARDRELLAEYFGTRVRAVDPLPALAPTIALLAFEEAAAGRAGPPHSVRPVYVRKPDAELARDRRGR